MEDSGGDSTIKTSDKPWQFQPGNPGGPGRPKGKTIKERVLEWLQEHPDDMQAFVQHFVKKNRDLAWQMLEGKPASSVDVTSGGNPLPIMGNVSQDNRNGQDNQTDKEN